jgi:hypothetical protein
MVYVFCARKIKGYMNQVVIEGYMKQALDPLISGSKSAVIFGEE